MCWKGYFNLDAPFSDIRSFFVLHITSYRFIISKFVAFNVWGSTNFVDFVEKKEENIVDNCFG
jgi:hypothetical protein